MDVGPSHVRYPDSAWRVRRGFLGCQFLHQVSLQFVGMQVPATFLATGSAGFTSKQMGYHGCASVSRSVVPALCHDFLTRLLYICEELVYALTIDLALPTAG